MTGYGFGLKINARIYWMVCGFVFTLCAVAGRAAIADDEAKDILALFAGGQHVALMRHALAPGTGDPGSFSLNDCTTQRNLDETGRRQARNAGIMFRENGVGDLQVYSSQWCRCMETAVELGFDDINPLALLNSFFASMHEREQRTTELREWLRELRWDKPVLLVTHQVNITALTGVYPSSGEVVVLSRSDDGELIVVGTIDTPY